jgi:hypothetical protein
LRRCFRQRQIASRWNVTRTPEKGDLLVIEQDIVLDQATAVALWAQQITIIAGDYVMDYSAGSLGLFATEPAITQLSLKPAGHGVLHLGWPANGWTLQETPELGVPWKNASIQTSPLDVSPTGTSMFYRLVPR